MLDQQKNIVIAGAGFAGLRTALDLADTFIKNPKYAGYKIILIDKSDTHLYTPDLYEIATAYYPQITETCLTKLKETVAVKIETLVAGKPITFLCDEVTEILPDQKSVSLKKHGGLAYQYLAAAAGSVTNYYDIPGLRQFSYPLKTIKDALAIQCHLDVYFQTLWKEDRKKSVNIVVGGGGATGTEFASEVSSYIKKLCAKYSYPFDKVHITIVEGKQKVGGLSEKASGIIEKRLQKLGVGMELESYITQAEAGKIQIKKQGKKTELSADMLVWTGGVAAHPLMMKSFPKAVEKGKLKLTEYLEIKGYKNVFAAGDVAEFPWIAQLALQEGRTVAKNIIAAISNKQKTVFTPRFHGMLVTVGGKYAVFERGGKTYSGFFCWFLHRFVSLFYAISIMPFWKALKKWWHATNIFAQND